MATAHARGPEVAARADRQLSLDTGDVKRGPSALVQPGSWSARCGERLPRWCVAAASVPPVVGGELDHPALCADAVELVDPWGTGRAAVDPGMSHLLADEPDVEPPLQSPQARAGTPA